MKVLRLKIFLSNLDCSWRCKLRKIPGVPAYFSFLSLAEYSLHKPRDKFAKVCFCLIVSHDPVLTQEDSNDIERVQKIALRIILDDKYEDYHQACVALNVQNLQTRQTKIPLSFAWKCLTSEKHKHLFKPNENINIRTPDKFDVPFSHSGADI